MTDDFANTGRVWLRGIMSDTDLAGFERLAELGAKPGQRLATSASEYRPLTDKLGEIFPNIRPVRAVAFNKTTGKTGAFHGIRIGSLR